MRIHTETTIDIESGQILSDNWFEYSGPLALADRSQQAAGKQAENSSATTAGNYGSDAGNIAGTVVPTLKNDINNPTGYTPQQSNNQLVAGEQGAGGAQAGITGAADLAATRTRNFGSQAGILDQAARRNAQTLSGNALNVANKSANLAQEKRQSALGGLEGMYGTDVGAQLKAMGIIPEDINSTVNAGKSGWLQNTEGAIDTIGGLFKP